MKKNTIIMFVIFMAVSTNILRAQVNLVPDISCETPNYWCTWFIQNYKVFQDQSDFEIKKLEGDSGNIAARNEIQEKYIFGENGWATNFYPQTRSDMYFLIDHGWQDTDWHDLGFLSMKLDSEKFPSYKNDIVSNLREFNENIKELGWRGLALWIRASPYEMTEETARLLVQISKDADIKYWKIDGGDTNDYYSLKVKNEIYPELVIEQSCGIIDESNLNKSEEILKYADILRLYDVSCILSTPSTLNRAFMVLNQVEGNPECAGILNVEDEVIMGAVLGCTFSVHRHPEKGKRMLNGKDMDLFLNGNRELKKRLDEVRRSVMWQRIAVPFAANRGTIHASKEVSTDSWKFSPGDFWDSEWIGNTMSENCPSIVSRSMELPVVIAEGDKPYVISCKFPNEAIAVATLGRCKVGNSWNLPLADVKIKGGTGKTPIGIFGLYKSLEIEFDKNVEGHTIYGQDLLDNQAVDITSRIKVTGNKIRIPGKLIKKIGTMKATDGDISDPGMILKIIGI